MKKSRINILVTACLAIGFVLGLAYDGIVGKAYAKTETPAANLTLSEGSDFEVMSTGTAARTTKSSMFTERSTSSSARAATSRCWSIDK